ncbi:GIY-YIG nuclease family protein [Patescibacteria group bacterium]|nr:GIY-YIG nuclease family protein [Patescibacteria group bacterium]
MYYIYIIFSKKLNKKYIGFTNNVNRRLEQHKSGKSKFTSKAKDWNLIYYEAFLTKKDAYSEEKFLKSGKGRERLKFLLFDTMETIGK